MTEITKFINADTGEEFEVSESGVRTEGYQPSNDIPLPEDHDELKAFAKAWIDTAAMHARNEDYWRKRAEAAEAKLATTPA